MRIKRDGITSFHVIHEDDIPAALSFINCRTLRPPISTALYMALLSAWLKNGGTVTTASVIGCSANFSAIILAFSKIMPINSSGENCCSLETDKLRMSGKRGSKAFS